jgi:hypothetical protein
MFIAVLFIIVKQSIQLKCSSVEGRIDRYFIPIHGVLFSHKKKWNVDPCHNANVS